MSANPDRPKVFLSYSHRDRQWADRLLVHLHATAPDVDVWTDTAIEVGANWRDEISSAITAADVAIVLVSADYLASDFILTQELPALLESARRGGTLILPVIVGPVRLEGSGLENFQAVNSRSRPLSGLRTGAREQVFMEVARAIERRLPRRSEHLSPESQHEKPADQLALLANEIASRVVKLLATGQTSNTSLREDEAAARSFSENSLVCVIMSFAEEMEPAFEGIAAAAQSVGLEAKRVKDVPGDYRIADKVMEMILSSRLVVADLTDERPNVYFELGYARGLGKTVVTVARRDTRIHFDVKDWTYIPYIDSRTLERDLRERLRIELQR